VVFGPLIGPGPTSALAASGDWATYLHDPQRTAANLDETKLSPSNAAGLVKTWSFATGGAVASSATVVGGTAYFGSWDGYEYAVDAATGTQRWRTFLGTTNMPGCFPPAAGVTSTAAVVRGVVYVGGGDSFWYALDSATGTVLWKVFTGDNSTTGGHYNWSSPLIANGFAYIGIASFGDCPLVQGQLLQVNLSTHQIVNTFNTVSTGQLGGGIWTSPSLDPATNTIFVTTGTATLTSQIYAQAVIALDASTLAVRSVWTLPAAEATFDSDWSTSPALLHDAAGNPLVIAANKNGNLYAFNRLNVGAGPIWRRSIAQGGSCPTCGTGTVSSSAIGRGMIFAAGGSTTIGSVSYPGSVRALNPADGSIIWEHPDPSPVIAALAYANGLVFAGTGPSFEVLSATTGNRLYGFTTGGTIFGAPTISNGTVYAGSTDGSLYAWGLPTGPPPPSTGPCPAGWNCADVGGAVPAGAQGLSGGTWTVQGGGGDIWGTADQFHFVWQPLAGDGTVSAHLTAQTSTSTWAKAGVMLRADSSAGAAYYAMEVTPSNGVVVQYRTPAGTSAAMIASLGGTVPAFVRVARSGSTFTAYTSTDGTTWTPVAGSTLTLGVSGGMLAGLAVTSHNAGTLSTASFDSVAIASAAPAPSSVCPNGWSCADIGGAAPAGMQGLSGGTWTVQGGGGDIWGTADQFHFVWQPLAGDGTVSAHVTAQTSTNTWAKAGVMLRADSSAGSAYYATEVTPGNGVVVQYRTPAGSSAAMIATLPGTVPAFVQVARSGGAFTAYTSADGATWTPVAGSSVTLGAGGGMLAGLAVTSHNAGTLSTATFDSVAIASGAPTPPSICPNGWSCADIGGAVPTGGQVLSGGTWTVQGGGGDIWGTADQFHFVWQPLAGDGTVSAHVTAQTSTSTWAKAGVMLRADSSAGSAYYAMEVTPSNGVVVQYRTPAGTSAAMIASLGGTLPAFVRVGRSGSTFTAYTSTDGTTWTPVAGSTLTLGVSGGMLAGLAVTSHNSSTASTVSFDSVAIV
jgi:outer membrane protein assembly factor BamB